MVMVPMKLMLTPSGMPASPPLRRYSMKSRMKATTAAPIGPLIKSPMKTGTSLKSNLRKGADGNKGKSSSRKTTAQAPKIASNT